MKSIKSLLLIIVFGTALISGCKKQDTYDPAKQLEIDEQLIKTFIGANNIDAERHPGTGIYYQIIEPGTGSFVYTTETQIKVKYTGRLLNGEVFDQNTAGITFTLGNLIYGWQIGVPLIQKGGKIRLLVPSGYAYGPQSQGTVPPNSVLDFEIELQEIYQ